MSDTATFSQRLKKLMKQHHVTQVQLASAVNVSQGSVSGWINGAIPTFLHLKLISQHLRCDPGWLITGKESAVQQTSAAMKLTAEQIFFLQDALTLRAEALLERSHLAAQAQDGTSADYWKTEAATAHQLSLLFKDALSVQVESVHVDKLIAENPQHHLEGWKETSPTRLSPSIQEEVAKGLDHLRQVESALLRPIQKRAKAMHPPAASQEPAASSDAQSTEPEAAGPASCQPHSNEGKSTSGLQPSSQASSDTAPNTSTTCLSGPGSTPHALGMTLASSQQGIQSPDATQPVQLRSQGSTQPKIHSSAQPTDACGDINCDGSCTLPAAA